MASTSRKRLPVREIIDKKAQARIEAHRALDAEQCLLPPLGKTATTARQRVDTGVRNLVTMVQNQVANCVTAGVALVGKENVFFQCVVGQNSLRKELPRVISIADHAIKSSETVFEVHDLQNTEFATHPNVMRIPHAASYASCSLCSPNAFKIGVLFVMRTTTQPMAERERRFLQLATRTCETLLWQTTDSYRSEISTSDNMATLCHELRNLIGPATTIATLLLQHEDAEPVKQFAGLLKMLQGNVQKSLAMVQDMQHNLVTISRRHSQEILEHANQQSKTPAAGGDQTSLTSPSPLQTVPVPKTVEKPATANKFEQLSNKSIVERYALLHDRIIGTVQEEVMFRGNPTALHQVFTNLISNAHKYANENSFIYMSSWVTAEKKHVIFSVRDFGPGIAKSKRQYLFSQFANRLSKTKHGQDSAGIGLFVCKHLVEQEHKGKIWLSTNYTRGCDFKIMLPIG